MLNCRTFPLFALILRSAPLARVLKDRTGEALSMKTDLTRAAQTGHARPILRDALLRKAPQDEGEWRVVNTAAVPLPTGTSHIFSIFAMRPR